MEYSPDTFIKWYFSQTSKIMPLNMFDNCKKLDCKSPYLSLHTFLFILHFSADKTKYGRKKESFDIRPLTFLFDRNPIVT